MPQTDWPYPLWIAHRGAGKQAPENTLAAFRLGAAHGYRAFECDVKLSADGVPFLLHDDTLDRTTPASGLAGERSWAELSLLDGGSWHSRCFAGEPLASFAAIAAYCLHNGFALNVEIKPSPGVARQTGHAVAAQAARWWAGQRVPPLLSSFEPEALAGARDAAPELPRALLLDERQPDGITRAQALACVAIVGNWRWLDGEAIAQIHSAGMRALSYTVNDSAVAKDLIAAGIDGLITDAIDRFSPGIGAPR